MYIQGEGVSRAPHNSLSQLRRDPELIVNGSYVIVAITLRSQFHEECSFIAIEADRRGSENHRWYIYQLESFQTSKIPNILFPSSKQRGELSVIY